MHVARYWRISAHEEFKVEFLTAELSGFCNNIDCPLYVGGDFNILRHAGDKNKKAVSYWVTFLNFLTLSSILFV